MEMFIYPAHHLTRTGRIQEGHELSEFFIYSPPHTRCYPLSTRLHATQPPCYRGYQIPSTRTGYFFRFFEDSVLILGGLRDPRLKTRTRVSLSLAFNISMIYALYHWHSRTTQHTTSHLLRLGLRTNTYSRGRSRA